MNEIDLHDDPGVPIYTDVMHQLLPLYLSLSLVGLRSFNIPLAACWGATSHSGQAGSWLRLTEPFRVLHLRSCFVQYLSEGEGVVIHYYTTLETTVYLNLIFCGLKKGRGGS